MDKDSPKGPFGSISIAPGDANNESQEQINGDLKIEEPERDKEKNGPTFPRKKTERRPLNWLKWTLLSVMVGFCLFLLVGYVFIPHIFSTYLPKRLSVELERPVTIGSVKFNPFTLNLSLFNGIIGPRLTNPEDKVDPVFSFDSWIINLEAISLLKNGLVCKETSIDSLFLHVVRQSDTTLNVKELLPPAFNRTNDAQKDGEQPAAIQIPFQYSLNNIIITNGHLIFQDIPSGKTHAIEEIRLALPALSNFEYKAAEYIRPEFSAKVNGSPIGITGQTGIADKGIDASLQLHLEAVDLPSYLAYLPNGTEIGLTEGKADLDIDILFSAEKTGKDVLQLEGSAHVVDLRIQDKLNKSIISIPKLDIKGTASPLAGRYHFNTMVLQQLEFNLERSASGEFGLQGMNRLLPLDTSTGPNKSLESRNTLRIDRIEVQNGRLVFVDRTVKDGFGETWSDIQLTISDYTVSAEENDRKPAIFRVQAAKENRSKTVKTSFRSQGVLYTLPLRLEGTLQANGIQLETYEPYQQVEPRSERPWQVKSGLTDFNGKFVFQTGEDVPNKGLVISETSGKIANFLIAGNGGSQFDSPLFLFRGATLDTSERKFNFGVVTSNKTSLVIDRGGMKKTNQKQNSSSKLSEKEKKNGVTEKTKSWEIGLQSLNMNRLMVDFMRSRDTDIAKKDSTADNSTDAAHLELEKVFIQVSDYPQQDGQDDSRKRLSGSARFNEKGSLQCLGSSKFSPFDAELDCSVSNLKLSDLQQFIDTSYLQDVTDGYLQAKGTLALPNFSFSGSMGINDLKIGKGKRTPAEKNREHIRWKEASGRNVRITSDPRALVIETVTIDNPFFFYSMDKDGQFFKGNGLRSGLKSSQETTGDFDINIKEIRVNAGEISVADEDLSPPYYTKITGINGQIKGFSSQAGNLAQVKLQGLQDGSAQLDADCKINFFVSERNAECNFKGSWIDISALSIYLEPHLGGKITSGTTQVFMKYSLDKGIVNAESRLDISKFSLGDNLYSDSPLSLAAALLTDKKNHIALNLPVRGDLRDTSFSFRANLVKVLRSLLAKAAVSPFSILDDLIKTRQSEPLDNQFFERFFFAFGNAEIGKEFEKNLEMLAWILQQRPALVLEITGYADGQKDRDALLSVRKKQAAFKRVVKEIKMSDQITKEYGSEEISPSVQGDDAKTAGDHSAKRAIKVDDRELLQLAAERSRKVELYLIEKLNVSPQQVKVSERNRLIAGSPFGRSGNRVGFNMTAKRTGSD